MLALLWRSERAWCLAGVAVSTLMVLAGLALLGLSGWFISASALAGAAGIGVAFDVFRPSAGIRFLALGRTASRYAERVVTHDATLRLLADLRVTLFRRLSAIDGVRLARLRRAELLQRLTSDVDALDNLYLRIALPLVVFLLTGLGLVAALLLLGTDIAWVACALLATAFLAVLAAGVVSRTDSRRKALALEALRVRTIDLVRAQTDLAIAGQLQTQRRSATEAATRLANVTRRLANVDIVCGAVLSLLGAVALIAVLAVAAQHVATGAIDGPQLALVVLVMYAALETISPLRRGAVEFGRTVFAARRLAPHLAAPASPHVETDASSVEANPASCTDVAVSLKHVTVRHAPERAAVVRDLSLDIGAGERVVLVGPSGAGKSTLLALIAGLVQPTTGSIQFGRPVTDEASPRVGLLTQRTELFRDTVAGNLRMAAPDASDVALWDALACVGLDDVIRRLPDGLQTRLGEGGKGLSGGEARRLALARIVLRAPSIWLLDEPTAGLDDELADRVLRNLAARVGSRTVVLAAHHDREIAFAHRVVILDAYGRIYPELRGRRIAVGASANVS
jgi:ATP-binding cassette subfamily C protein CydC